MSETVPRWQPVRLIWPLSLMALVAWLSGKGQVHVPFTLGIPDFDKFAHFGIFGLLTVSVARVGGARSRGFGWTLAGLVVAVVYGLLDEVLQGYNPARSGFDVADWLADVAGAVTAFFLWRGWGWGHRFLETPLRFRRPRPPSVPPSDPASPNPPPA